MNELIKINTRDNGTKVVRARDLYIGLGFNIEDGNFSRWIKKMLNDVDAIENKDYTRFVFKNGANNANITDYAITIDISKEICMIVGISPRINDNTKSLSKKYRKYFIECEKELIEIRDSYMIKDQVERAKRWMEEEQERQRLADENKQLTNEVIHKEDVIIGLVDEISLADKRQILNRVVRYNGAKYSERWSALYREFENVYHINLKRRFDTYNENNKPKMKSKLDYIDKVM